MYWVTGILGLILVLTPFAMGFSNNLAALWTSIILGLVVAAVSFYKAFSKDPSRWEYRVAAVMGLIAIFAPFLFTFSTVTVAMLTVMVLGALIALLTGYQGFFARPRT